MFLKESIIPCAKSSKALKNYNEVIMIIMLFVVINYCIKVLIENKLKTNIIIPMNPS